MPEKEITSNQVEGLHRWLREQAGEHVIPFGRMGPPNTLLGVWKVGGEPFVIEGEAMSTKPGDLKYSLLCSRQHAEDLERAGIVSFPEESLPGAQTP